MRNTNGVLATILVATFVTGACAKKSKTSEPKNSSASYDQTTGLVTILTKFDQPLATPAVVKELIADPESKRNSPDLKNFRLSGKSKSNCDPVSGCTDTQSKKPGDPTSDGGEIAKIDDPTGHGGDIAKIDDPTGHGGDIAKIDDPTGHGGDIAKIDDPTGHGGDIYLAAGSTSFSQTANLSAFPKSFQDSVMKKSQALGLDRPNTGPCEGNDPTCNGYIDFIVVLEEISIALASDKPVKAGLALGETSPAAANLIKIKSQSNVTILK